MNRLEFRFESEDAEIYESSRLDVFLTGRLENFSRSSVRKLNDEGNIYVNGLHVKAGNKLKPGDTIQVLIPAPLIPEILPEDIPLDIIYEDLDLIVVNKPQGMVVHPAAGHYTGTLVNALLYHCASNLSGLNGVKRPGIVHRIDKDTSGILVAAKNDISHRALAEQLAAHEMARVYEAVVHGCFNTDTGTVDKPIGRHPTDRKKMAVNYKNGRHAITHYKVLECLGKLTLLEARLETGRTHQIRVHMSSIGHPLLGDGVYGKYENKFGLTGQALHAKILGFTHPTTKEHMLFEVKPPDYFASLLTALRM